jgi:agmatinase
MYRLVEADHVDPARYVQIGLRGYWPGEKEFGWQAERGTTAFFMHDVRERGIQAVVADTLERVGPGLSSSPWTSMSWIRHLRLVLGRRSRAG